jgi:hypothetical protein
MYFVRLISKYSLVCILCFLWCYAIKAGAVALREYEVKAAFLYNFAKFIDWPESVKPKETDKFIIGTLGDNVFGDDLQQIEGKQVSGARIVVRSYSDVRSASECHILFVCPSEKANLNSIFKTLEGKSILTVSDIEGFATNGGMIEFYLQDQRVHFEINRETAARAGLKINSQLLKLAKVVPSKNHEESRF